MFLIFAIKHELLEDKDYTIIYYFVFHINYLQFNIKIIIFIKN